MDELAARIAELERRAFPDYMVWKPRESISGKWEASGPDGAFITEDDPAVFADKLEARLADPADGR